MIGDITCSQPNDMSGLLGLRRPKPSAFPGPVSRMLDAISVGSLEEKNICFLFLRTFLGIFHFIIPPKTVINWPVEQ